MPIEPGIPLLKDEVLKRITEEEIFERYLQLPVDETTQYINPLRIDNSPGCKYYRNTQGRLRFKDFSKGYNWDCFSVVQYIYNCSFIDALRIIVKDFKLNTEIIKYEISREVKVRERYRIEIKTRAWENADLEYWFQFNISTSILSLYSVYPCKSIWVNGEYYRCRKSDPCYAYYFGNNLYKLYFPKRIKGENRFFTNVILSDNFLQGYSQLPPSGDLLIITKSYKDIMSIFSFNLASVAPQSESQIITQEQYDILSNRFHNIIALGDNDSSGRRFLNNLSRSYNIPSFLFPWTMEKDFSDNVKKFGKEKIQELIIKIKLAESL